MAKVRKYINGTVRQLLLDPDARFLSGGGTGTSGVTSFNTRTGAIVPASNDYTFAQIGSKPTTISGYGITDAASNAGGSYTGTQSYAGNQTYGQGVVSAWYNTVDQTTNFERLRIFWNSNTATISSDAGGTGVTRNLQFTAGLSNFITTNNSTSGSLGNIRANSVVPSTGGVIMSIDGTQTASSGTTSGLAITPNINQTGTSSYRMLWITAFEQAVGSGTKLLLDAGVNSAANGGGTHTSKFSVDNAGLLTAVGGMNTGNGNSQSNFGAAPGTSPSQTTAAGIQFGGSTNNAFRAAFNGTSTAALTTGSNYSAVIVGSSPITTFTSGTHTWIANMAIAPLGTVTSGGATVTNTATLYVGAGASGGTNNYGLYCAGNAFALGNITSNGLLTASTTSTFTGVATFTAQDVHNGGININGGEKHKRTTVADAAYTVLATDYLVAYTTLTATRAVTLATASSVTGQYFIIKDETGSAGTNAITIVGTVDGATNKSIATAYGNIRVYSNGTAYFTW